MTSTRFELASAGAIGNAEWSGVNLKDVLEYAGLDERSETDAEHVQFEGLDSDMEGVCYGASIPIEKALYKGGDVLLAYEMNGRCVSFAGLGHNGVLIV